MARAKEHPAHQPVAERRVHTLRRQFNESFTSPDGRFSAAKTIAVFAQIAFLYHTGKNFEVLILHWEALLVCSAVLIAPDVLKKIVAMRYGNGTAAK